MKKLLCLLVLFFVAQSSFAQAKQDESPENINSVLKSKKIFSKDFDTKLYPYINKIPSFSLSEDTVVIKSYVLDKDMSAEDILKSYKPNIFNSATVLSMLFKKLLLGDDLDRVFFGKLKENFLFISAGSGKNKKMYVLFMSYSFDRKTWVFDISDPSSPERILKGSKLFTF